MLPLRVISKSSFFTENIFRGILTLSYTINEVAKKFELSAHTLRFYDKEGLLPYVSRNKSGNRAFTETDLDMVKLICCLKNTGMQIKEIKQYIDLCVQGTDTIEVRKKMFIEHRKEIIRQLGALKENLSQIDSKIKLYESPDAVRIINEQIARIFIEKQTIIAQS